MAEEPIQSHADRKQEPQDAAYWEARKAELEARKLELEYQQYPERLRLENSKLKADVNEWLFRALFTVLGGIASIAGFYAGKLYERSDESKKEAFQLQLERDRLGNESFHQNLALLSSSDPGQRNVAATNLLLVAERVAAQKLSDPVNTAKQKQDNDRLAQILGTVSVRFPLESDPLLLEKYSQILAAGGKDALGIATSLDSQAGTQFALSAAAYAAWNLNDPSRFAVAGCQNDPSVPNNRSNQKQVSDRMQEISDLTARSQTPFVEGILEASGRVANTAFDASSLLKWPELAESFQMECRRILNLSKAQSSATRAQRAATSYDELIRAVQVLTCSSFTLNRILREITPHNSTGATLERLNLDQTLMLVGSLNGINLSGSSIQNGYIAMTADHFVCRKCNFSSTDMTRFNLVPPFDLDGSTFADATLSNELQKAVHEKR
jgi:hypothetical protein